MRPIPTFASGIDIFGKVRDTHIVRASSLSKSGISLQVGFESVDELQVVWFACASHVEEWLG